MLVFGTVMLPRGPESPSRLNRANHASGCYVVDVRPEASNEGHGRPYARGEGDKPLDWASCAIPRTGMLILLI
jgi:hypothetical protein